MRMVGGGETVGKRGKEEWRDGKWRITYNERKRSMVKRNAEGREWRE
jgi:hypothetical protein